MLVVRIATVLLPFLGRARFASNLVPEHLREPRRAFFADHFGERLADLLGRRF